MARQLLSAADGVVPEPRSEGIGAGTTPSAPIRTFGYFLDVAASSPDSGEDPCFRSVTFVRNSQYELPNLAHPFPRPRDNIVMPENVADHRD
jgi:hypothetical protein